VAYTGARSSLPPNEKRVAPVDKETAQVWAWWMAQRRFRAYCDHHAFPLIEQTTRFLRWHGLLGILSPRDVCAALNQAVEIADGSGPEYSMTSSLGPALEAMESRGVVMSSQVELKSESYAALQRQIDRHLSRAMGNPHPEYHNGKRET